MAFTSTVIRLDNLCPESGRFGGGDERLCWTEPSTSARALERSTSALVTPGTRDRMRATVLVQPEQVMPVIDRTARSAPA
jgi:hypothetical protein